MHEQRAVIFANGEQIDLAAVLALLLPEDYQIAADGGLRHLTRLGLVPDLLIGDLDSVDPSALERLRGSGAQIEQHPIHKDETDLELALDRALRAGYRQIVIFGALVGRLDMTLANIFLLGLPELEGLDVRLEDGIEEVFLITPGGAGRMIAGRPEDRVSLLPLGGPARGITTSGLYYPLNGETLYPERTRGVSNRMLTSQARVTLEVGKLICIHTRREAAGDERNEGKE